MAGKRRYETNDALKAKALKLWRAGLSTPVIGERLGRSSTTVKHWLLDAGVRGEQVRTAYWDSGVGGAGHQVPAHIETDWGDRQ